MQRRFDHGGQSRALRAAGAAARRQRARSDSLLHADARSRAPARRRLRHPAFPYRSVSFPAVSADRGPHGDHAARPPGPARSACRSIVGFRRHAAGLDLQRAAPPDAERELRGDRLSRPARRPASRPRCEPRGGYLAFLGRISPEKRPDRAIAIARALGIPLKIAAKVDRVDEAYFRDADRAAARRPRRRVHRRDQRAAEDAIPGRGAGAAVSDRLAGAVRPRP